MVFRLTLSVETVEKLESSQLNLNEHIHTRIKEIMRLIYQPYHMKGLNRFLDMPEPKSKGIKVYNVDLPSKLARDYIKVCRQFNIPRYVLLRAQILALTEC